MNTILFDLDGTLLPMNTDAFAKAYFNEIGSYFSDLIDGRELLGHILGSTKAMVTNTEFKTNEEVFMEDFRARIGDDIDLYKERFNTFYDTGFLNLKSSIFQSPLMIKAVNSIKEKGYNMVVATNPQFPLKAILHRIEWAGLEPEDFIYISSYEKNHYCKPQIKFYEEILKDIGKTPEECLMVGNDVEEDLIAGKLGIKTYLIEDNVQNSSKKEIVCDFKGSYEDFLKFAEELPFVN
jgi:FMN phosphatase YigB (HAD superfamily)